MAGIATGHRASRQTRRIGQINRHGFFKRQSTVGSVLLRDGLIRQVVHEAPVAGWSRSVLRVTWAGHGACLDLCLTMSGQFRPLLSLFFRAQLSMMSRTLAGDRTPSLSGACRRRPPHLAPFRRRNRHRVGLGGVRSGASSHSAAPRLQPR